MATDSATGGFGYYHLKFNKVHGTEEGYDKWDQTVVNGLAYNMWYDGGSILGWRKRKFVHGYHLRNNTLNTNTYLKKSLDEYIASVCGQEQFGEFFTYD